ncbi:FH1/FH2 domain-containing protein 3 isoform 3 [Mus musculus]|uniref:Isoform 4 of FH1/FH2 domain-containing protein 3 n=1 Tax=Mus musculus TaxID=10090 RepID=Q76LL6-4|nr:FH1/FH2 domain-containing protein 3 isoform 3 [Mus musculus]BAC98348.1 FHOS2M splicing variant [Mus musculus]|eukprot:NP_001276584.1 FH1/FH2 domain-containing protein 3 isoform 3 [Mus musculus]
MATLACRVQFLDDTDPFNSTNFPEPSRPPLFTFREDLALGTQLAGVHRLLRAPHKLDDCTLQLSHNGAYLDLEATLAEQRDELEGFQDDTGRGKKNSIILRTQLSVRVHACIEKLYNSSGRDLRRALFSLKQIFQDDKDLVHEFVIAEGLTCLIKVGAEADQNYQNYILRALGQIMLYVDGMNGVINHSETIQWLYTLVGSKFRLVVKTALKLLLVFVEYSESNAPLLIQAVSAVDTKRGVKPWSNIMEILEEKDGVDTELLVYAMTLVNKTLAGLPDQDTFYDVVDCLEELGIAAVSQRHLNKKGTDLDLLEQFNIYEVALRHEDGDETAEPPPSGHRDRRRASMCSGGTVGEQQGLDRRRSRRHSIQNIKSPLSAPTSPCSPSVPAFKPSQVRDLCENKASSASGQSSPGKDAAPESSALHTTSSPTSQGRWLSASTAARSPVLGGTSGPEASRPAARLLPPSPGLATRPSTAPKVSPTIDKLPYVPHSPFHLFSYDFEDSPLLTKDKGGDSQTENRYSNFSSNSFQSSRPSPGPSGSPSYASSFSSPQDTRSSPSGLLTSSFRQHQESLAAERERRRQEREERLQRIEREERNKFNREYLDKREEQRQARGERYKYLEQLAAETQEKEPRSQSVSRGRADLSLDLSLPAAPAPPSPSSQSPSADSQEALPVPSSPPTLQCPQVSGKDHEPELEAEAGQGADEASQDIASAHRGAESQEEPVLELEPEERASLSEKERQNEEVNERDNCSASSISSSSSTLEREEKEDKLSEDRATGLWSTSLQDVGVNGQCGDILTSKRFMLDMLYAHNRKSTEDEEKDDGEPGRSAQEVEAVASLATRISTLQANSQAPEESIKRVDIGCLDNRGSVKAFAEKFNSGEVGRGAISPDVESQDKVPDTPPAQLKTESDYIWDQLMANPRELRIQDMDFTDLGEEDDIDVLDVDLGHREAPGPPPPPPPTFLGLPPPPPPPLLDSVPPPPVPGNLLASPVFNTPQGLGWSQVPRGQPAFTKKKKTIRLFWNEVRPFEWPSKNNRRCREFLWSKLEPIKVDTSRLEHLFESKSKELSVTKKTAADGKRQEIIVLDSKRSNAINIGLTVLPPPRTIKIAILNFDEYALNKEGIEKILTMIPTEEEKQKIQEAQLANPEVPLGSAEQFLLTLSSISELSARLHLWAFKMDYETTEKEVAEPLLDLKEGIDQLENNKTLGFILSTLLAIGNFLNGTNAKAFELSYLEKVPEVKDTVHKQSLLHHVCTMVVENFPDSSDLYSEIGAITRSAKVDFDQLQDNLCQMERRCKASWDHLKAIAKHEMKPVLKQRMSEFLKDCAERIIILKIVHRRIINRFHSFLLFMGHPPYAIREVNINKFCRIISEFALEYRTTRERVLQQKQKRANHRERNKTRGKMITDSGKFSGSSPAAPSQPQGLSYAEDAAEHENMKAVLKTSSPALEDATPVLGVRTRSRASRGSTSSWTMGTEESPSVTDDAADEIMDRIVKSATQVPSQRVVPRERKRSRANRKSLRRTLKSGLTPEEARALGLVGTSELQL